MELTLLCDAKIAILVFSPAGNPFCFGHPSVDDLLNHYCTHTRPPFSTTEEPLNAIQAEKETLNKLTSKEGNFSHHLDEIESQAELQRLRDKVQRRLGEISLPSKMSSAVTSHVDQNRSIGGEASDQVCMYSNEPHDHHNHVLEKGDLNWDKYEEIAAILGDNACDSLATLYTDITPSAMTTMEMPHSVYQQDHHNHVLEKGDLNWDEYEEIAAILGDNACDLLDTLYTDITPSEMTTMEMQHSVYQQAWSW